MSAEEKKAEVPQPEAGKVGPEAAAHGEAVAKAVAEGVGAPPAPVKLEFPPDKFQILDLPKEGVMVVVLPVGRMSKISVLGFMLEAQDVVRAWYFEREQRRKKILAPAQPGLGNIIKNKLQKIGGFH